MAFAKSETRGQEAKLTGQSELCANIAKGHKEMPKNLTDRLERSPKEKRLLEQERLILEVTELICGIMEEERISRSELAKRLQKSKGHVSQLLDGSRNMTLRTLAEILSALGRRGSVVACRGSCAANAHQECVTL